MIDGNEQTRMQALFDHSPDAIVIVDREGRIVRANDRVADLFGYEPAELVGERVEILVPEPDREAHPAQRDSYMADPSTRPMGVGLDLRGRRKDGSTFPVEIGLSPIETHGGFEVIAAIRDVTEQEQLRRKYRTVMETAPDAMFVVDAETGEIMEINDRAAELVERPEGDLVGRTQTVLHPSEDADRYRALFEHHVATGQVTASQFDDGEDFQVVTADGERIPVEISAQVTHLNDATAVVALFRDISDRRAYERELHRQIDRLERLAHVLSHDLRNPLNVAELGVDLARESGDLAHLDRVETAHERIQDIVTDSLAMISEGAEVESVEGLALGSLVTDCWETVDTCEGSIEIVTDGTIEAEDTRVRHLFENLFRNAVEHGGDCVGVRAGVTDDGFFVEDDGPGIPADEREAVFEPGWTSAEEGTGLGLNIVAEIATAHGWDVAVTEGETGGARFEFTGVRTDPADDPVPVRGER
ncbi:MAG: PAS domain S-box protein [Haloarculaceae archaeon]